MHTGRPEILDLTELYSQVDELRTRGVYVRDDQVQALDGAGWRVYDPDPKGDRAGRPWGRKLHDAPLVAHPGVSAGADVKVHIEPELLGVDGLRPIHIRHGYRHQFELPIHGAPSFRVVACSWLEHTAIVLRITADSRSCECLGAMVAVV